MNAESTQLGSHCFAFLEDEQFKTTVDETWKTVSEIYEELYDKIKIKPMERPELSFHDQVKLLGFLCLDTYHLPGDILEIGVWKGKSLSFMKMLSQRGTKVVGVDPCELKGQKDELMIFAQNIIPDAQIIVSYSEKAISEVVQCSQSYKIIHIDGGHERHHVWTDFMLYSQLLAPGGYLIFDDYADEKYSPEVKIAVDELFRSGRFDKFRVLGPITGFLNSYVLQNCIER